MPLIAWHARFLGFLYAMLAYILAIYEYYYGLGGAGYWVIVFILSVILILFTLVLRSKQGIIGKLWIFASAISILLLLPTIIFWYAVTPDDLIGYLNNCCPLPRQYYETIPPLTYYYEIGVCS